MSFKWTGLGKLPVEWEVNTMEDSLCEIIDYRGKTPAKSEHGIPTLSAKSVKNGYIDYSSAYCISEETYKTFMVRGFPKKGDVLLTTEAPLGYVAKLDRDNVGIAQRLLTLRGKRDYLNNDYLRYYLMSPIGQHQLRSRETGTTVTGIKQSEFRKALISVPSLNEQKAISHILSTIDEKIEVNNQINKTIESIAQEIFKHWFVDFEFPNEDGEPYKSSGGEMVESELGLIPKGWQAVKLNEIVESVSVKHKLANEKVIFLNTSDIYNGEVLHNDFSAVEGLPGQAKKSIQKYDILYSEIRPQNRRFAFVDFEADDFVVSTKLMVLRSKGVDPSIPYFLLTGDSTINELQRAAESRSGTFPQITFESLKSIRIAIPECTKTLEKVEFFNETLSKICQLKLENKKLVKLRDILLPKLMSGELRVPTSKDA